MAELENINIKKAGYLTLNSLIDELLAQKEILQESKDPEILVMANLKILGIARKFAKVDEYIFATVNNTNDISGTYFSEVLTLETLRLRFKEEVTKCESLKQIQT